MLIAGKKSCFRSCFAKNTAFFICLKSDFPIVFSNYAVEHKSLIIEISPVI